MMGVTSIRIDENKRRVLKVKGLVADMPDNLEIDITDIGIGKALKVGELSFDKPDPLLVASKYKDETIALICALLPMVMLVR
jgi:hypothetical protein